MCLFTLHLYYNHNFPINPSVDLMLKPQTITTNQINNKNKIAIKSFLFDIVYLKVKYFSIFQSKSFLHVSICIPYKIGCIVTTFQGAFLPNLIRYDSKNQITFKFSFCFKL